jgi:hypothetical protein
MDALLLSSSCAKRGRAAVWLFVFGIYEPGAFQGSA